MKKFLIISVLVFVFLMGVITHAEDRFAILIATNDSRGNSLIRGEVNEREVFGVYTDGYKEFERALTAAETTAISNILASNEYRNLSNNKIYGCKTRIRGTPDFPRTLVVIYVGESRKEFHLHCGWGSVSNVPPVLTRLMDIAVDLMK